MSLEANLAFNYTSKTRRISVFGRHFTLKQNHAPGSAQAQEAQDHVEGGEPFVEAARL